METAISFNDLKSFFLSERLRRLSKEGCWVFIGQIITVFGSMALVRVLTEQLPPAQFGQLSLGLTIAGLINQVVMGGISVAIGRFFPIASENREFYGYLHSVQQLMLYATIVVFIIGIVLMASLLCLNFSQWAGLAVAVIVFSILSGYNSALNSIQNAARQRAIVAFHSGINVWLKIFLILVVFFFMGDSSTAVVIAYAISVLLIIGSQFFFLYRLIHKQSTHRESSTEWLGQIWSYSWPFSLWGIFTWGQQCSDRWALNWFASTEQVGSYVVLLQLGYTPISMATSMATSFLSPIVFQQAGDGTDCVRNINVHRLVWRITAFCFLITLIACLLALWLHSWIFSLLVAEQYRIVSYLLPWMVLAGGLFACGQLLTLKILSAMKSVSIAYAKIITSILGVLFNIYGAFVGNIKGIVLAGIAFSGIYFFWIFVLSISQPAMENLRSEIL
jgi:O-antigen/teichoic acid export membrane protein